MTDITISVLILGFTKVSNGVFNVAYGLTQVFRLPQVIA